MVSRSLPNIKNINAILVVLGIFSTYKFYRAVVANLIRTYSIVREFRKHNNF
jgi:hypothetical protein